MLNIKGFIKANKTISITMFLLAVIYIPILLLLSENMGIMMFRTGDEAGYFDTIRRLHIGFINLDLSYAFSGSTFSYGYGYFLLIGIITFPFFLFDFEQSIIFLTRYTNVLLLIASVVLLINMIQKYSKTKKLLTPAILITLSFPAVHMILLQVHPEMAQVFFLLIGIMFLGKAYETNKFLWNGISGIAFGCSIAIKISSFLFFVVPLSYLLFVFMKREYKRSIIYGLGFGVTSSLTAIIFTYPLIWLEGMTGLNKFIDEYKFFGNSLKINAIAEFDLFKEFESKAEILKHWFYHPYSYGYIFSVAFYLLIIIAVMYTIKNFKRKNMSFPVLLLLLVLHFVTAAFYTIGTTRISTYYYLPSLFILIPILITSISEYITKFKMVKNVFLVMLSIQLVYNINHNLSMIENFKDRSNFAVKNESYYEPVKDIIVGNKYLRNSIYFDISIPLNINGNQIDFSPGSQSSEILPFNKSERFMPFITIDEAAFNQDLVIVSKRNAANYNTALNFIERGMKILYEDNYSLIITKNQVSEVTRKGSLAQIPSSFWFPQENTTDKEGIQLTWAKDGWEGGLKTFDTPQNMSNINKVELELLVEGDLLNGQALNFIFNGLGGTNNYNAWDYNLLPYIKKGKVTVVVDKEKFKLSNGTVQWNYVTAIGFGGVMGKGANIRLLNVKFE